MILTINKKNDSISAPMFWGYNIQKSKYTRLNLIALIT